MDNLSEGNAHSIDWEVFEFCKPPTSPMVEVALPDEAQKAHQHAWQTQAREASAMARLHHQYHKVWEARARKARAMAGLHHEA